MIPLDKPADQEIDKDTSIPPYQYGKFSGIYEKMKILENSQITSSPLVVDNSGAPPVSIAQMKERQAMDSHSQFMALLNEHENTQMPLLTFINEMTPEDKRPTLFATSDFKTSVFFMNTKKFMTPFKAGTSSFSAATIKSSSSRFRHIAAICLFHTPDSHNTTNISDNSPDTENRIDTPEIKKIKP